MYTHLATIYSNDLAAACQDRFEAVSPTEDADVNSLTCNILAVLWPRQYRRHVLGWWCWADTMNEVAGKAMHPDDEPRQRSFREKVFQSENVLNRKMS